MTRPELMVALGSILAAAHASASEVRVDGRTFRVPDGYVIEKVAASPLVDRPIVADFDERGRLYVADSSGSNAKVKDQLIDRPHRIVRLEDTDGDGTFDRSVVFADRMMFPEGAMWLDGSLYVAAPPSIWKLTDTDGDGVADRREEWFQGKTLTGCANDLHGPYAGPDGRVYWCKGAFAPQTYDRPGRKPLETRAAHVFRAKVDGSGVEPVMTGGMDNPVEVAFTPGGERIFTTTFFQQPAGGRRDGLVHALYGGLYGKVHDVIDGHVRTSPEVLPPLVHLGPAAPSGLMRAESDALGSRDALFTACFNLRKVARTVLTPRGGTFDHQTDDFVSSEDIDFHPTDVLEDADGSLLVVDTGGWYKLCCPTSQLVKPDVLGAIYRVRRSGSARVKDPRGLSLAWADLTPEGLAGLLADARPAVRRRAVASLAAKGDGAMPALSVVLRDSRSNEARRDALWAACRVDSPAARAVVRAGLDDADPIVRQVAAHASGLGRDAEAVDRLAGMVTSTDLGVARASAEALGRIGRSSRSIPELLRAAGSPDPSLRHSATYALIELDDPNGVKAGLASPKPEVRRSALMALEQMEGAGLEPDVVLTSLNSPSADLREAAWWVAGRHPEWGGLLAGEFARRLDPNANPGKTDLADLETRLASMARFDPIRDLIGERANGPDPIAARVCLRAMAGSGLKELPAAWLAGLRGSLGGGDPQAVRQAIATARTFASRSTSGDLLVALRSVADRLELSADVRLEALAAAPSGWPSLDPSEFAVVLDRLKPDRVASERSLAADVAARTTLTPAQRRELAGAVASAGPIELPRLLDAFDKGSEPEVGRALVESLRRSSARSTLRLDNLKPRLARYGGDVAKLAEVLYAEVEADSADRVGHLEALLGQLSGGDARRGQAVFYGTKAACVTCHAIGYVGGKLGPDMTKIGQVRAERDLLEAIVYPSASFVRSYEPVSVALKDGRVVSGLLRKDAADEVVVALAADREERIPRDQVDEIAPGTVSVMPAGLDRQLTSGELADLIAFLKGCR